MFEKVIREDPKAISAKNDLAFLLAQNGEDLDRAAVLAEESRQVDSTDPRTADTLGFIYLRKGLHEAALNQFQFGLEMNGDRPGILAPMLHYHLGLTLRAMDRNAEAAAAFERALALDADFPEAVDARRLLEESRRRPVAASNAL
jgi:tetratricopeptide (TPR) repeat protein